MTGSDVIALVSVLALLVNGMASLVWSKRRTDSHKAALTAKDAELAAKDSEAKALRQQIQYLKELDSVKLRERFRAMKESLEEAIEELEDQRAGLESDKARLRSQIDDMEAELGDLLTSDEERRQEVARLRRELEEKERATAAVDHELEASEAVQPLANALVLSPKLFENTQKLAGGFQTEELSKLGEQLSAIMERLANQTGLSNIDPSRFQVPSPLFVPPVAEQEEDNDGSE